MEFGVVTTTLTGAGAIADSLRPIADDGVVVWLTVLDELEKPFLYRLCVGVPPSCSLYVSSFSAPKPSESLPFDLVLNHCITLRAFVLDACMPFASPKSWVGENAPSAGAAAFAGGRAALLTCGDTEGLAGAVLTMLGPSAVTGVEAILPFLLRMDLVNGSTITVNVFLLLLLAGGFSLATGLSSTDVVLPRPSEGRGVEVPVGVLWAVAWVGVVADVGTGGFAWPPKFDPNILDRPILSRLDLPFLCCLKDEAEFWLPLSLSRSCGSDGTAVDGVGGGGKTLTNGGSMEGCLMPTSSDGRVLPDGDR